ncbi:heterokaryon incompatibility protein-domain-containing protein [Chaetomium strumarium]|uniref:Heterokaryon incompatibility protein-domain-containing protein n=1 Tax=Chaetomium strumarium TaxID=1170767 RepID=A0AAJ0GXV5_9PEZI|nr:heterokaryon incompatibility protein-domain-containing protein [Chaetomium strumarium]
MIPVDTLDNNLDLLMITAGGNDLHLTHRDPMALYNGVIIFGEINAEDRVSSPPSFVHAPEHRLYQQPVAFIGNAASNRDIGELMSRDTSIAQLPLRDGGTHDCAQPDGTTIQPMVAAKETALGSVYAQTVPDGHFRLLEILAGTGDTQSRCRLHVCAINDNCGAYEALSYTWKTETIASLSEVSILCNDVEFTVGANLHMALARLRREDAPRVIWADAICINQNDEKERGQQVAAMGTIFHSASRVIVWLGPDEDVEQAPVPASQMASEKAFAGVCSVILTWAEDPITTAYDRRRIIANNRPQYRVHRSNADKTWNSGDGGALSARSNVRLWVIQEVARARRATVVWGRCEIAWQWVGLAAAIIRTNWNRIIPPNGFEFRGDRCLRQSSRQVPEGVMNTYFMYRVSRSQLYFDPLRFSFCELLAVTIQFGCQDDRDKVYGLLGLETTDNLGGLLTPDYTRSLADLYRTIAFALLKLGTSLDFLAYAGRPSYEQGGHGQNLIRPGFIMDVPPPELNPLSLLPSWVPRWHLTKAQTLSPLDKHPDFAAGSPCTKSAMFKRPKNDKDDDHDKTCHSPDRLSVRGVMIERVTGKHRLIEWEYEPNAYSADCHELTNLLIKYRHTKWSLERLAMTLTAGKSWYGTPVESRAAPLAHFARCLLSYGMRRVLDPWFLGARGEGDAGECARPEELAKWLRCLFTTSSGMQGVGPLATSPGDMVAVINSTPMPFVIRYSGETRGYELLGECYIDDLIHGEAFDGSKYKECWIDLV